MFNYGVNTLFGGGNNPYDSGVEQASFFTVQNIVGTNITLNYPRQDILGWDGSVNRELVDRPTVGFSFIYLPISGYNERNIGFATGLVTPALSGFNIERNYYIKANNVGYDSLGYSGLTSFVLAFGNCVITRYEFSCAVGQLAQATVTTEALNLLIQTGAGSGQIMPTIVKQTAAAFTGQYVLPYPNRVTNNYTEIQPGSITLSFNSGSVMGAILSGNPVCPIQSFAFTIDTPRVYVKSLGSAYPDIRPITFPISIGIRADVALNSLQTDQLNRFGCPDSGYDFTVQFKNSCTTLDNYSFIFKGAKLDSESIEQRVGPSNAAQFSWSLKINDLNRTGAGNPNFYLTA
jgi:hypothetical protein